MSLKKDKMKNFFYVIFAFLVLITSTISIISAHNIHMGIANIEIEGNTLSGKVTFFKDDFFASLRKMNNNTLKNLNAKQYNELKLHHMKKFFKAFANDKKLPYLTLIDNGEDESSIWFTLKFTWKEKIKLLTINWTSLFDIYKDQTNILNIKANNEEKSFILTEGDSKAETQVF